MRKTPKVIVLTLILALFTSVIFINGCGGFLEDYEYRPLPKTIE